MKKYEGIVFDLDGTLIDSVGDIALGCNACLAKWGLPERTRAEVLLSVGFGPGHLCHGVSGLTGDDLDRFLDDYITWGKLNEDPTAYVYAGITEALERLQKAGIHLGIYTNREHAWGKRLVAKLFRPGLFSPVIGTIPDGLHKPDPHGLLQAAEQWSCQPERLIMMGDSPVDVATGRAAGSATVAVTWGYTSRQSLIEAKPDALIDTVDAFVDFMGI